MSKHFAICQYYEPFVMGGKVWQWRRFEVESEEVDLVNGFKGFAFLCPLTQEWRVHEVTTGGLLGEGESFVEAAFKANEAIKITPDLREQMAALGDTSLYPVVEASEALRRIAKKRNV